MEGTLLSALLLLAFLGRDRDGGGGAQVDLYPNPKGLGVDGVST